MPKFVDDTQTISNQSSSSSQQPPVNQPSASVTEPTFYEISGFPSRGIFYPAETKIFGRPLKVLEVKQLANINETNADQIINSVLRRTIKGIDIDDLEVADKLFVTFWLRANTYMDSGFTIKYQCDTCKQDSSYELLLDKLEIKYLDKDFSMDNLTFKLPKSGNEIYFSFPRVRDEKTAENFKTSFPFIKDMDDDIVSQAVLIQKVNGEFLNMLEKYNFISNMSPIDYVHFVNYLDKYSFGVKPYIKVNCKSCGGQTLMGITFQQDFWIPSINIG